MNLGTLLSSAGQVSSGMREAEENERIARENQLRVEELNRRERERINAQSRAMGMSTGVGLALGEMPVTRQVAPAAPAAPAPAAPAAAAPAAAAPKPAAGQRSITPTVPRIKSTWSADDTRELQKIDTIIRDLAPLNYNPYDYILYSQPRFQNMLNSYFPNYAREIMDKPIQERGKAIQDLFTNLGKRRDELLAKKQQWNTEQDAALSVIQRQTEKQNTERYYRSLGLTPPASAAPAPAAPASAQGATTAAGTTVPAEIPSGRGRRAIEAWIRGDGTSPAAAAAPTAPATTVGLTQYDAPTQYDGLIQQAAVANGLDPVVFKRLIGSESSFNPNAKSRRGDEYGLGIAQIAAVHGLSREEMLDPATALPFAAQLFKQYLDESGGDYRQAILRYKGATSERGIQEMNAVIDRDIFPEQTTTVAAAAPARAAEERPRRNVYLENPQMIPVAMQQALQQRNELANMGNMYLRIGDIDRFEQYRSLVSQADNSMYYLQGMQGLQEFEIAGDPRRLSAVWSHYAGMNITIQPRTDSKYDLLVDGQTTREGLTFKEVSAGAQKSFDEAARRADQEFATFAAQERFKSGLKREEAGLEALAGIEKAIVEGEYKLAEQRLRKIGINNVYFDSNTGAAIIVENLGNGRSEARILDLEDLRKMIPGPLGTQIPAPLQARTIGLQTGQ